MSDTATLLDTVSSMSTDFLMDGDWEPIIHEEGSLHYPKGYGFVTKLTAGTKGVGGRFTMIASSHAQELTIREILSSTGPWTLTLPNGDSYGITIDPATDRQGTAQFSLMLWQWVNKWTVTYSQVS